MISVINSTNKRMERVQPSIRLLESQPGRYQTDEHSNALPERPMLTGHLLNCRVRPIFPHLFP